METTPAPVWIDRFAMALSALAVQAEPTVVGLLGAELYPTLGHLTPEEAARAEYDEWPPQDT